MIVAPEQQWSKRIDKKNEWTNICNDCSTEEWHRADRMRQMAFRLANKQWWNAIERYFFFFPFVVVVVVDVCSASHMSEQKWPEEHATETKTESYVLVYSLYKCVTYKIAEYYIPVHENERRWRGKEQFLITNCRLIKIPSHIGFLSAIVSELYVENAIV